MNFKEGDIVEIRNESIKVLTPVTFINGTRLIFFAENSYDIQTKNLKIKFEYSTNHIYPNCKIKKVRRWKLITELTWSLMNWGYNISLPYLIHRYQIYIKLKKLLKNNMTYLKYFLYKLEEEDFYNVVSH